VTAILVTSEFIATGGEDGIIRVITHKSRSILRELLVHTKRVEQIIAAVEFPQRTHSIAEDGTLTTTDWAKGERVCQQQTTRGIAFTGVAQFADGETEVIVSLGDGKLRGYDWPRTGVVLEFTTPQRLRINAIALRPGSRVVVCGGQSEYLAIGDLATAAWKLSGPAHSTPVRDLAWTPDGRFLLSCSDEGVGLWDV
jgi:WD40 repeat protein